MAGLGTVAISLLLQPVEKAELGSIFLKSAVGVDILKITCPLHSAAGLLE